MDKLFHTGFPHTTPIAHLCLSTEAPAAATGHSRSYYFLLQLGGGAGRKISLKDAPPQPPRGDAPPRRPPEGPLTRADTLLNGVRRWPRTELRLII